MRLLMAWVLLAAACGDDSSAERDSGSDAAVDTGAEDTGAEDTGAEDTGTRDSALPDAPADVGVADAGGPVNPLEGAGAVELVAEMHEGRMFRFLEGPHWRPDGTLVFSDLSFGDAANTTIFSLTPPSSISVLRRPSEGANGNATGPDGDLYSCLQGGRRVVRGTGSAIDVFARFEGDRFNAPNDLVFRSDGTWYFTDPGFGVDMSDQDLSFRGVFRVTPAGEINAEYTDADSRRPNGVELSVDEATLYVADTERQMVRAFEVAADGTLSGERAFATGIGGADGMAVDAADNLYVTSSSGVQVFAPDGTRWGTIEVPRAPANCAFGDDDRRTLYITAREGLYRVRLPVRGR
ncbi:MAG: SMP-30/gluconolactonase/LRE family protein [Myxococcota bacterium]